MFFDPCYETERYLTLVFTLVLLSELVVITILSRLKIISLGKNIDEMSAREYLRERISPKTVGQTLLLIVTAYCITILIFWMFFPESRSCLF